MARKEAKEKEAALSRVSKTSTATRSGAQNVASKVSTSLKVDDFLGERKHFFILAKSAAGNKNRNEQLVFLSAANFACRSHLWSGWSVSREMLRSEMHLLTR